LEDLGLQHLYPKEVTFYLTKIKVKWKRGPQEHPPLFTAFKPLFQISVKNMASNALLFQI
jgi:hypothetical protein